MLAYSGPAILEADGDRMNVRVELHIEVEFTTDWRWQDGMAYAHQTPRYSWRGTITDEPASPEMPQAPIKAFGEPVALHMPDGRTGTILGTGMWLNPGGPVTLTVVGVGPAPVGEIG